MPQEHDGDDDFEVSSSTKEEKIESPVDPASATPDGGVAIPAAGDSPKSDSKDELSIIPDDEEPSVTFDERDLSTYPRDDHGCYVNPVTKKRFIVDINGSRIPAAEDQNIPICVPTAQEMQPIWAAQNEELHRQRLELMARENPSVALMLEENAKLRAQLEALQPKRAKKKEAAK